MQPLLEQSLYLRATLADLLPKELIELLFRLQYTG